MALDIVEIILAGQQPRHPTLDRLIKAELPSSWRAQCQMRDHAAN